MRLFPAGLIRRKQAFARSATRHFCSIDCELVLTDSMVTYDGRLIDISTGGAMFRPRLAYLMSLRDVPVVLRIGKAAIQGEIVGTSAAGFGIKFDDLFDEEALLDLLAEHDRLAQKAG
ncbi:MAG TPA: PilZ domain-containing protein [Novosphingobium sp.]